MVDKELLDHQENGILSHVHQHKHLLLIDYYHKELQEFYSNILNHSFLRNYIYINIYRFFYKWMRDLALKRGLALEDLLLF